MQNWGFIITRDALEGDSPAVGKRLKFDVTPEVEAALDYAGDGVKAQGLHFTLLDDDGILYYEGMLVFPGWDKGDEPDEEIIAAPLDQFGRGYAGCSQIRYADRPEWEFG